MTKCLGSEKATKEPNIVGGAVYEASGRKCVDLGVCVFPSDLIFVWLLNLSIHIENPFELLELCAQDSTASTLGIGASAERRTVRSAITYKNSILFHFW